MKIIPEDLSKKNYIFKTLEVHFLKKIHLRMENIVEMVKNLVKTGRLTYCSNNENE